MIRSTRIAWLALAAASVALPSGRARADTWVEVSTGEVGCTKIQFLDDSTGFILGSGISRTTNAGVTWTMLTLPASEYPTGFHFFNAQNGLVTTGNPVSSQTTQKVMRTSDGGKTWTPNADTLPFSASGDVTIGFSSATNGYLVGRSTATGAACTSTGAACDFVYKTTDGGATWTAADVSTYSRGWSTLFFLNDTVGYTGGSGGIFRTTDGGTVWTMQYKPTTGIANFVNFFDANFGLASQDGYQIVRTSNGGTLWTLTQIGGGNRAANTFAFRNATTAFALARTNTNQGQIWRTVDAGATWTQDTLPANLAVTTTYTCAAWPSANVQYAVGFKVMRVGTPGGGTGTGGAGGSGSGGMAGTGGATGMAGASGSGGATGTGGDSGSGGATGTGGDSGSGGATDPGATGGKPGKTGGGGGCRIAGGRAEAGALSTLALALGLALLPRFRRRWR